MEQQRRSSKKRRRINDASVGTGKRNGRRSLTLSGPGDEAGYRRKSVKTMPGRHCFVTVGATAAFTALVEEVLSERFLAGIRQLGFESMDLQCGDDFSNVKDAIPTEEACGIRIHVFPFDKDLTQYYLAARGDAAGERPAGVVIAHGGAGTIMEVVRLECALILVANPTLMNNHQVELVDHLHEKQWAIRGHLGKLTEAVSEARQLIYKGRLDELAPYREPVFPVADEDRLGIFDCVVLTCYPEELAKGQHLAGDAEWRKGLPERAAAAQRKALAESRDKEKETAAQLQMD